MFTPLYCRDLRDVNVYLRKKQQVSSALDNWPLYLTTDSSLYRYEQGTDADLRSSSSKHVECDLYPLEQHLDRRFDGIIRALIAHGKPGLRQAR